LRVITTRNVLRGRKDIAITEVTNTALGKREMAVRPFRRE
jgi:hypothetical protein